MNKFFDYDIEVGYVRNVIWRLDYWVTHTIVL